LGLRVESDRAEVEVIVVDAIERPTENWIPKTELAVNVKEVVHLHSLLETHPR